MRSPVPIFAGLEALSNPDNLPTERITNDADYRMACAFLLSYRGSEATFTSYRREVERLLQWVWGVRNTTLPCITRDDFEAYLEFCQKPPQEWIGTTHVDRFINEQGELVANPKWRPFVVQVSKHAFANGKQAQSKDFNFSQSALRACFSILSSFFNYLVQENYVANNPIALIRQKNKYIRKIQTQAPVRRLSQLQWAYVLETARIMAEQQPLQHERTLFIMTALFAMYLRISELAASARWQPKMGDFQCDRDGNWWFTTVGKGNKQRMISVSDDMLEALKRYRKSLGLSALPTPGETTVLVAKTNHPSAISSTRHIRKIVQGCFDQAIERMQRDNLGEESLQLRSATVHWLRHTGISEDVKHRPREHVRDDAGHSSSAITDRYIDIELRARAASAKHKRVLPED